MPARPTNDDDAEIRICGHDATRGRDDDYFPITHCSHAISGLSLIGAPMPLAFSFAAGDAYAAVGFPATSKSRTRGFSARASARAGFGHDAYRQHDTHAAGWPRRHAAAAAVERGADSLDVRTSKGECQRDKRAESRDYSRSVTAVIGRPLAAPPPATHTGHQASRQPRKMPHLGRPPLFITCRCAAMRCCRADYYIYER